MNAPHPDHFYAELPLHELPLSRLLVQADLFEQVPADWHVVITDIKGSTQAVLAGLHDRVNLVATGSIIAAINLARQEQVTIPFFFGGDGATMMIPNSLLPGLMAALMEHRENTSRNFGMDLRVGSVAVSQVYLDGFQLNLAKVKMSNRFSIPVVLGGGLQHAESLIKGRDKQETVAEGPEYLLDLEGMECRWNHIKPPEDQQEVISLLVVAREDDRQGAVFGEVLEMIDQVYGPPEKRQPISVNRLRLKASFDKIGAEVRTRLGRLSLGSLLKGWVETLIGKWYYFVFDKSGKAYLQSLVELADTLVMDGRINTVITGTIAQRNELRNQLNEMEERGDIWYGLHASEESVLSCYVRDRKDQHIHFVDGSEGGYTQAARMLKEKLRR